MSFSPTDIYQISMRTIQLLNCFSLFVLDQIIYIYFSIIDLERTILLMFKLLKKHLSTVSSVFVCVQGSVALL